jgi:hypothetical protein
MTQREMLIRLSAAMVAWQTDVHSDIPAAQIPQPEAPRLGSRRRRRRLIIIIVPVPSQPIYQPCEQGRMRRNEVAMIWPSKW